MYSITFGREKHALYPFPEGRGLTALFWLKLLWRKTAEFDVLVSPHPKEGHPTLMTKASRFSSIPTKDKKRLYILAEKNDDVSYKKFIGQVLLNEKPGDIYKDKKSRARNKTDTKNLGNELKDNQDFWR